MVGTDDRYISVGGKTGKTISNCFGHGYKTRYTAFIGTITFLKKKQQWVKNQKKT